MLNRYGVPDEQNDRLLELAGEGTPQGCRHEPKLVWPIHTDGAEAYTKCKKCGMEWDVYDVAPYPAVGDGHQMPLGELVRLVEKLWPGAAAVVYRDGPYIGIIAKPGVDPYVNGIVGNGASPEAALAAAIIAAVDGEKA